MKWAGGRLDTGLLQRVGNSKGSHQAGLFADEQGRRFYVKMLESPAHARNELIAAMLYRLAGAPTLTYVPTLSPVHIATAWVSLDKTRIAHFDDSERRQAQRWFGVHAWTANWDVAGFDGDNLGVADGTVLTLDLGGALEFRAMGDPKGKLFGHSVPEFERLRRDGDNPHAMRLFGEMAPEELHDSIAVVTRIPDDLIRHVVLAEGGSRALADKLLARKADLARRAPLLVSRSPSV